MKALIIEDKAYIRKGLRSLLETINYDIQVIGECSSVKDALIVTNACNPDLVFLDINLADGNAFDFLEQIENLNFKVIFITAYHEYALKALKFGAVDYILKPVDIEELEIALKKVKSTPVVEQQQRIKAVRTIYNPDDSKLVLSLQDSFQVIALNELIYCESDKGYTTFYCVSNKKYLVSKTIKEFEERLLNSHFIRPHQSFIINLNFIDKYDKAGTVYLKNGKKIPVSSRKKGEFLSTFLNWTNN